MSKRVVGIVLWVAAAVCLSASGARAGATPRPAVPPASRPPAAGGGPPAQTHLLPATGQVTTVIPGDDGSVRAGAPLRYVTNANGTITDKVTGLMWEKKVKLDSVPDAANVHDADNCYPWHGNCPTGGATCGTDADCGNNGPCEADDCQVGFPKGLTIFKVVERLNRERFAGYTDWRVPNVKELLSIIDFNAMKPAVAPAFNGKSACGDLADPACSATQSGNYWSSTALTQDLEAGAWFVTFANGVSIYQVKQETNYVRAVRGGL